MINCDGGRLGAIGGMVWYGGRVPHPGAIAMQGACVLQHPSWLTKVGGRREERQNKEFHK